MILRHPKSSSCTAVVRFVSLVTVAFTGCSSPGPEPAVESVWGETSVVEELAIGVETGDEEYMFGVVRDVAAAPDGTIWVVDSRPMVIRMYDADGEFIRDVGREGQGPGEYQSATLQVLPDGRVAVWDYMNNRISLFSSQGVYQDGIAVDASLGGSGTLQVDTEGNLYVRDLIQFEGFGTMLRKYSIEGEPLGTVELPEEDREGFGFVLRYEGEIEPFIVKTVHAWSPLGYIVAGRNDRYDIELRKPSGPVHVTRDLDPVPVNPEEHAEWNAFRDRVHEMYAERNIDQEVTPIPQRKPYFRELRVGADGRIWVFRYVEAVKRDDVGPIPGEPERPVLTWREPWTWDVFEPDSTFLGAVVLPDGFEPHAFRGTRIWGAHTDEGGVQRVVRLRIVPESG